MAFLDQLGIMIALGCSTGASHHLIDVLGIQESGWNTTAYNRNHNGTDDLGALQINSINRKRLGISDKAATDPCVSVRAASTILVENGGRDAVSDATVNRLVQTICQYNAGQRGCDAASEYAKRTMAQLVERARGKPAPAQATAPSPTDTAPSALAEPVSMAKGAQNLMVFDGWSK